MDSVIATLIPSLVAEGIFGEAKYTNLEFNDCSNVGLQFASALTFATLTVEMLQGKESVQIVVKVPTCDSNFKLVQNSDVLFHNEVTMYNEILPHLACETNLCPKMFYGKGARGDDVGNKMLILEDLTYKKFKLSDQRIFLDFDHVSLVIKSLAKFHSYSYISKNKDRSTFLQMAQKLEEVVLNKSALHRLNLIHFATVERGVKPLLKNKADNNLIKKFLSLMKNPHEIKKLVSLPEEPFAVICHGDFCNNNVFYKYDELGSPIECAFFDFQLSIYSSPGIDLFFFLYMHTTFSFREKYWDEILLIYWSALRQNVPSEIDIPCFEDYLTHLSIGAIYGYIICSWFLPSLMDHHPVTKPDYNKLSLEEKVAKFTELAGEDGDRVISEAFIHLLKKGYIKSFVQFCNERCYAP